MNRRITNTIILASLPLLMLAQPKVDEASTNKKSREEKKAEKRERINKLIRKEEEGTLIYQKQDVFGFKLATDGFGLFYEKGIMKTVENTSLYFVEFGERKSNKQEKLTSIDQNGFSLGNSVIYGKQNNFFYLKLGIGQSKLIGGKGNRNGVAISAIYGGGLSLGLLKPYYLKVIDNNREATIKYLDQPGRNDSLFLDPTKIITSAGLFKGFNEIKMKPGIHAKASLRFDYGKYNEVVSAVEAGINAEYYFGKMPIMALNTPRSFFINAFVAINFGRRK